MRAFPFLSARNCDVLPKKRRKVVGRLLATALNTRPFAGLAQEPAGAANKLPDAGATLKLRVLATSDLHANILAWNYHANKVCASRGLARTATLIATARAEAQNSLLFDNGDFLNGTALGDHVAHTLGDPANIFCQHPMIAAMNHLGYDAATLGNHEFSNGLGALMRSLRDARFPIVASNLRLTAVDGDEIAVRSVMLTRDLIDDAGNTQTLRIAVAGFLPPQTTIWEHRNLKGQAEVDDIVRTAIVLVPELRAAGADLVIVLSHSGLGDGRLDPFAENASLALAGIAGIDVVVAGHTHTMFPTPDCRDLAGKPVVMPGFFGSHLGVIDLALSKAPDRGARWQVMGHNAAIRPIARRSDDGTQTVALAGDDPVIAALAALDHAALLAWSDQPIGQTPVPLHSFFALLTQSPALDLISMAQTGHLSQALADGAHAGLPVLSATAPFTAGGRGGAENYTAIAAGPLVRRNVGDLYLHPNSLVGLCLPGHAVLRWLERSVSLFHQVIPGAQDADLINPDFPSYDFDVIYGLTYQVDLSQPARFGRGGTEVAPQASRIVHPCYLGEPVRPDQMFALASNSYRCAGGSGFERPTPDRVIYEASQSNQSVVEAFIQGGGQISKSADPIWAFAPMKDTTALFDCDPRALAALQDVPHLRLTPVVRLPNGFQRFRLHL